METKESIHIFQQDLLYNQTPETIRFQNHLEYYRGEHITESSKILSSLKQTRRVRQSLDLKAKRKMFELSKQGLTHRAIANHMNVGRSTVTKVLLNRNLFTKETTEHYDDSRKRVRSGAFDELEFELFKWCVGESNKLKPKIYKDKLEQEEVDVESIPVRKNLSKEDIVKHANHLSKSMELSKFVPTHSWFFRFKRRFRLNISGQLDDKSQSHKDYSKESSNDSELSTLLPSTYTSPLNIQGNFQVKSNTSSYNSVSNTIFDPKASRLCTFLEHDSFGVYHQSSSNYNPICGLNLYHDFEYGLPFLGVSQSILSSLSQSSAIHSDKSYSDFTNLNNFQSTVFPYTQTEINLANYPYTLLQNNTPNTFEGNDNLSYFSTSGYFDLI